jgi:hypothetical protein
MIPSLSTLIPSIIIIIIIISTSGPVDLLYQSLTYPLVKYMAQGNGRRKKMTSCCVCDVSCQVLRLRQLVQEISALAEMNIA